jgi:hypothetical protein
MLMTSAGETDADAEQLMREAAEAAGPIDAPVPLDYGLRQPRHERLSNQINAGVGRIGGWRQLGLSIGLACVLGGLGYCVARNTDQMAGVPWMAIGGLILGIAFPLTTRR